MIFIAHDQATEVEKPGEEPFDFPPTYVAAQAATVLGAHTPIGFIGCDHFRTELLHYRFIQPVAVVSFVTDQALGHFGHEAFFQRWLYQLHFSWRSTFCPQGERKTVAVCNAHDLGSLAAFGFAHQTPPFLAGTNVPSTKHSFRSKPPASRRCSANLSSIFSITPERTQFWKRRCTVWYAPYRGGKSCHGAPVLKIH